MSSLPFNQIAIAGRSTTTPQPRLLKAAAEFEAQMMQELLKPLAQNGEETDGALEGSMNSLQSFAAGALGTALAREGGFGIASSIVRELSHDGTRTKKAP